MGSYKLGPLTVEVESLGPMTPPWGGYKKEDRFDLVVSDRHGHSFKGAWSANISEAEMARRIVSLLGMARDEGTKFLKYFYDPYNGEERRWRREEAGRILEAANGFNERELIKATAQAYHEREYEGRGPKDWSPTKRLPE